ncbi:MAG: GNAT family N-acetyltransferase [Prevotellaceae bacterium]|nr:GNAT family N-acetyltransferase [Prevotellaceae bacterium]
MEPIIAPIDRRLILHELSEDKFLKKTNKGDNELYILDNNNAPNTMLEIGRLREISFRVAGGGTGKAIDIDPFDVSKNPYKQLIVWNSREQEILGGYRYIYTNECEISDLATSELFHFSDKFKADYMPYTVELGRSFVQPDFQSSRRNSRSLYALDNLWDGLGGLILNHPNLRYLFGKVTMYTSYNVEARNMVLYFMQKHFPDKENLVLPMEPLELNIDKHALDALFTGRSYEEDHKILSREVRARGEYIPPLINSYMNLSATMKTFGTAINHEFGAVEETGILVTIGDIYREKLERHVVDHHRQRGAAIINQLFPRRRSHRGGGSL